MITILAGFCAGALHVLSGPDHLAAIAPISVQHSSRSWIAGCRWGFGHSAGVLLVGGLFLVGREMIPVELISGSSERLVGLLLIGIGGWAFRKAWQVHSHPHAHAAASHEHIHIHRPGAEPAICHGHEHAAFGIGTLHGLAGSSHFIGVLPALALPSSSLAVSYLAAYGFGTIVAMALFASLIGAISRRFSLGRAGSCRGLMLGCATFSIGIGGFWVSGYAF
jgi:hypothetical protein